MLTRENIVAKLKTVPDHFEVRCDGEELIDLAVDNENEVVNLSTAEDDEE